MEKSICFYFPYHEDSGVPVLFYRMANIIAESRPDIEVYVVDYENGAMARNILPLSNLKHIVFERGIQIELPKESILVMQTFLPYYWPEELKLVANQKIFFWNLHPQNLIPSVLPIPFLRELPMNNFNVYQVVSLFYNTLFRNLRSYVHLLLKTESLYFMDKTNLDFTAKYLFTKIESKQYIPVPATPSGVKTNFNSLGDTIRIGWVGRLCDFKSHILIYTINKLSEISNQFKGKRFIYHIVGDGPYLDYIKKNIKICEAVTVNFHGALAHDKLDNFINDNFDIMTGMGTSALEGAKLGKPTILLDFTFKKVQKDYVFREIYNTVGFDLAHLITHKDYKSNNNSLYTILSNIISDYSWHSQKSEEYFQLNHNIENVKNLFIEKVFNTKLTFSMIDPSIMKKSRLLRFYNKLRKLEN